MKKILDVPYYSQYKDVKDEYWKPRACGVLCLKMVLDFLDIETGGADDFIKKGNQKGTYGESGWIHQGLIDIAKDFDVNLYRKEFKGEDKEESEKLLNQGIEEILESLKNEKPVIISAIKKWSEKEKFHMIVLTGFEADNSGELKGFYYNDTDYNSEQEGKNLFVDIETFKIYWRRLTIFVNNSKIDA